MMNQRFSVYLDLLRFLAALIVFVSHFAYARFTDGHYLIIRELNLGSDAVVLFFVLSGLVISYTAETKDKTLKQYSFSRLTRLYSVIIPAVFLTIILDKVGQFIAAENYSGWWHNDAPILEKLWYGLSLSSQWMGQNFRIGTNGPYWSLSYEAAYYILFGIAYYTQTRRKFILLLLAALLFGFSVLFLLPAWLLGVWTYKQIKSDGLPQKYSWYCAVLPPFIYMLFLAMDIPGTFLIITNLLLGHDFVIEELGFSDEFVWNLIIAQLISFHLLGVATIFKRNERTISNNIARIVRWCAGATFTIYIVHYPLLQFMDSILPETLAPLGRHALLFASVIALCFLFAELSERRLKWFREKLCSKA